MDLWTIGLFFGLFSKPTFNQKVIFRVGIYSSMGPRRVEMVT